MDGKRLVVLFGGFVLAFTVVLGRCAVVGSNTAYAQAAQGQLVTSLPLGTARGNFYDAQGVPLTGQGERYYALCIPGESSYARLFDAVTESAQGVLYTRRNSARPFLVSVPADMTGQGIYTCAVPQRYLELPIASHLLGYLNGDGEVDICDLVVLTIAETGQPQILSPYDLLVDAVLDEKDLAALRYYLLGEIDHPKYKP